MNYTTRILCNALGFSALLALSAAPAWADTTLVINAFLPAQDTMNTQILRPWADAVTKATDGRVKVQIPPSSVAAPDQLWNSVRSGVVDGAYLYNGLLTNQLKLMHMPQLPFLGPSANANSVALWRTYDKYFKAADEYKSVHLLGVMVMPSGILYSLKGPIESEHDLQGVKVWALPGVPAKMMAMAKAGVNATPAARMSEIVAGGMVDVMVGNPDMYSDTFKVMRYAKSATMVPGGFSTPSWSLVLNRPKWESISPADREIITKLSGEALAERAAAFDNVEAAAHAAAVQSGVKYLSASPQFVTALEKSGAVLTNQWLATAKTEKVDGAAALAYYKAQSAVVGK